MMNGFWEQSRALRTGDVDIHAEWRAGGVFQAMQEVASAHCEEHGLGIRAMRERNLAWVISRARLHMERLPRLGETVTVRTWPKPPQHFFFPRYFAFFENGEAIGAASMLYVQLDLTSRHMAKPWLGGNDELTCDLEPSLPLPGAIPNLAAPVETVERVARYSDLDFNGHVNNARYLDWFYDCFPEEHFRAWRLTDTLIHYDREITPGERVELSLQQEGVLSVMKGASDGKLCFAISGEWAKR
jgi:medium-chain acyl-[acyl-carrier-protein] hydrolase